MGTKRLVLVALLLFASAVPSAQGGTPQEPFSNSKPLSYWLTELRQKEPGARILAAQSVTEIAVMHGGSTVTAAIPALLGHLDAPEADVREAAAAALEQIGQPARDAVPRLLQMFASDPAIGPRRGAGLALGRIEPTRDNVVHQAALALRDVDPGVRVSGVVVLVAAGPAAERAHAALEDALDDPDPIVRVYAAAAIGRSGAPQRAATLLLDGLRSSDVAARVESAGLLVEFAPGRPAVVDTLAAALQDAEPQVRVAAADALGAIGRPARSSLDALWDHLRDPDERVRDAVVRAATQIRD